MSDVRQPRVINANQIHRPTAAEAVAIGVQDGDLLILKDGFGYYWPSTTWTNRYDGGRYISWDFDVPLSQTRRHASIEAAFGYYNEDYKYLMHTLYIDLWRMQPELGDAESLINAIGLDTTHPRIGCIIEKRPSDSIYIKSRQFTDTSGDSCSQQDDYEDATTTIEIRSDTGVILAKSPYFAGCGKILRSTLSSSMPWFPATIVAMMLAMWPLCQAPYIYLWILDWTPDWWLFSQSKKIGFIERIANKIRQVESHRDARRMAIGRAND